MQRDKQYRTFNLGGAERDASRARAALAEAEAQLAFTLNAINDFAADSSGSFGPAIDLYQKVMTARHVLLGKFIPAVLASAKARDIALREDERQKVYEELAGLLSIETEEDGSIGVGIKAMPGHVGGGNTFVEACVAAEDAAEAWIEASRTPALLAGQDAGQSGCHCGRPWPDHDTHYPATPASEAPR
jgi:predicted RNase H-like HicB family nuclease